MPGCVIIDSRNVYDKLSNKVLWKSNEKDWLRVVNLKGLRVDQKKYMVEGSIPKLS